MLNSPTSIPDSHPRISIVTVVRNGENLVSSTMQSVFGQTARKSIEYIVVEGKSTDDTLAILKRQEDQIDILLSEKDSGVYDAMNKGLRLANGEFILFLNAGDTLENARVVEHILAKSDNADILYGETNIINAESTILGTRSALTSRKLPLSLRKKDFLKGQVVSHQSFIPKRSIIQSYNLSYKCSADIDWMIKAVDQAKSIVNVNQVIANYLQGGISDRQLRRCWIERLQILLKHFNPLVVGWMHVVFAVRFLAIGRYKKR